MNSDDDLRQPLAFPDTEKNPLSIRAKALVFVDPRSRQLRDQVERLAAGGRPVLIGGETGTGKELLARHIHKHSTRQGLFVALNCGTLSPRHGEAELFGHAPGAYSGSAGSRAGWFGSATGGTLYLDEIGDLPLPLQRKLLQALETREVLRIGARQPTPVDVRLVAATSIDLARAVAAGTFDERLHAYLEDGFVDLPPLRERRGDILTLAEYFLALYANRLDLPLPQFADCAQHRLLAYDWPGNIRELESAVHFALLVCRDTRVRAGDLNLRQPGLGELAATLEALNRDASLRPALRTLLQKALDEPIAADGQR